MLAIGGLLLQSTLPISVTFAQTFVKGGAATVSSLMMGFAWGMGSLFVPLIGWPPTASASSETLAVLAFVPLLAAVLAWRLPDRGVHHVEPKVDSLSAEASLYASAAASRGGLSYVRFGCRGYPATATGRIRSDRARISPGGQDPDHHERRRCS